VCPIRFCRLLENYRAAKNANAPLSFRERVVYSLSQTEAAEQQQSAPSIFLPPDAF